jgi:hypothetical protein
MSRGFDGERRLTEAKRTLTTPPTLKEVVQPFGHGEHPLPHRQRRENVIDQARRCFGHAPRVAGGARASTSAGIGDQEIVLTLVTVSASEAAQPGPEVEFDQRIAW